MNSVYSDDSRHSPRRVLRAWKSAFALALSAAGTVALYFLLFEADGLSTGAVVSLIAFQIASLRVINYALTGPAKTENAVKVMRPYKSGIRTTFTETASNLIRHCREEGEPLAMLLVQLSDLPELRATFGDQHSRRMVRKLFLELHAFAPPEAVVMRTEAAVFCVLMPGLDREAALAAFEEAFGHTLALEFDAGEDEIVLVPDVVMRTMPASAARAARVYQEMLSSIEQTRAIEARRERRLRREHESYYAKTRPLVESVAGQLAMCGTMRTEFQ